MAAPFDHAWTLLKQSNNPNRVRLRGAQEQMKFPCKGCDEVMVSHEPRMFGPTGFCDNCLRNLERPSHGGDPLGRWLDEEGNELPPEVHDE